MIHYWNRGRRQMMMTRTVGGAAGSNKPGRSKWRSAARPQLWTPPALLCRLLLVWLQRRKQSRSMRECAEDNGNKLSRYAGMLVWHTQISLSNFLQSIPDIFIPVLLNTYLFHLWLGFGSRCQRCTLCRPVLQNLTHLWSLRAQSVKDKETRWQRQSQQPC